ncbi:MAG: response regulator [Pyrinomonadaceae bacterium]|nr:response regulator [Pyrinomonadaceae bacterium]
MRIMFVDDERRRMRLYVEELQDNGHEVLFEDNVDSALAVIEDPTRHFDLLVLDISMPPGETFEFEDTRGGARTGLALYDKIRGLRPDLKIVALTSVAERRVVEQLTRENPRLCLFLRKPENLPFLFAQKVETFLSRTADTDNL